MIIDTDDDPGDCPSSEVKEILAAMSEYFRKLRKQGLWSERTQGELRSVEVVLEDMAMKWSNR